MGIPAVAWTATSPVGVSRPAFFPPNGQPRNTTVTLDFDTPVPQWRFSKRWVKDVHEVGAISHRLAADWTAPIDFFWYMCDLDNLRIQNTLIPRRYTKETGLYFLQPYDPAKIPVVMVHGLVSSPDAYRHIINDLSPEPWFRKHYQIWLYNYPTGTPWLYNAMRFRQIVGEAANYARSKGTDKNLKKMVILSHSMGGLLTRAAITDPKTALYDAHFRTPLDQLGVRPDTRKLIREGLLYKPLTDPKRVVFMAVPHRGSPMANFRGTALLSNLIRLPKTLTVGLATRLFRLQKKRSKKIRLQRQASGLPHRSAAFHPRAEAFLGSISPPSKGIPFTPLRRQSPGDAPESSDAWCHTGRLTSSRSSPSSSSHPITAFPIGPILPKKSPESSISTSKRKICFGLQSSKTRLARNTQ